MKVQDFPVQLFLLIIMLSFVAAEYVVKVRVHGYDNPTNRCPVCRETIAFPPGCCDKFDNFDCEGADRCDNSFFYCLKELDSAPDLDPRATTQCGFHNSEGIISHQNEDGAFIDFTRSTVLGIPNPFQLSGITPTWTGVQLYVEVEDIDGQHPSGNTVVDTFSINIDTTTAIGTFSNPTWYNGTFGYASIQLSYKVECTISHYSNCDTITCAETRNCSCIPGYTGVACERNIDECLSASCPANSVCLDAVNSHTCECRPGFSGENCISDSTSTSTSTLVATTEPPPLACNPGYTGLACEVDINECSGVSCSGNGECRDGINGYTCSCHSGFTGADCETRTDHCARVVCTANGECLDGRTCTCQSGFTGIHCEVRTDDCFGVTGSGRGECVDRGNFYSCLCQQGYSGVNCELDINECARVTCSGNGRCQDELGQFRCECDADYTGLLCETKIDDCLQANCSATEQCVDGVHSFQCVCRPGFTGELCETPLRCTDMDCNGNGVCTDRGNGVHTCDCYTGYYGEFCDLTANLTVTTTNSTFTLNRTPSANMAAYLVPVGVAVGLAVILGLVITGAIVLTKVCITKHQHVYEDVIGGGGNKKTPDSTCKISTYVNESYNFTGRPSAPNQLATPSPPLPGTLDHPKVSERRHMSMPQTRSKLYENHTTIRAHRLNTISGMNTSVKTQRSRSRVKTQGHSSLSKPRHEVYENSATIRTHRLNTISGHNRSPATTHSSHYKGSGPRHMTLPHEGPHKSAHPPRGNETPTTPPLSFPPTHREAGVNSEPCYINSSLSNYSVLTPDNDLYDTYDADCHPYLDYQPHNYHPSNTEDHYYEVDSQLDGQQSYHHSQLDGQQGYHHYDMDSQLSDSDNHTYEKIPE